MLIVGLVVALCVQGQCDKAVPSTWEARTPAELVQVQQDCNRAASVLSDAFPEHIQAAQCVVVAPGKVL